MFPLLLLLPFPLLLLLPFPFPVVVVGSEPLEVEDATDTGTC